jgi:hypothetical protein
MIRTAASRSLTIGLAALTLAAGGAFAQAPTPATPPTPTVVRGTITAMTDTSLTVKTDKGPQVVSLIPPGRSP